MVDRDHEPARATPDRFAALAVDKYGSREVWPFTGRSPVNGYREMERFAGDLPRVVVVDRMGGMSLESGYAAVGTSPPGR